MRPTSPLRLVAFGLFAWLGMQEAVRGDDWPQWLGPKRDGIWRETGILEKFPKEGAKIRWRQKIGAGYAGPAVAAGKVYITDRVLPEGVSNPKNPFGRSNVKGKERVLCLEESSGKILWKREYDCPYQVSYGSGPRCTPLVDGERVYTLGTMGDLLCLSTKDGNVIWSKNFPKDYKVEVPVWGFAGHPLLEGNLLICLVGGEGSVAVAFDKMTGKEVWRALSASEPGYAPPTIIEVAGKRQLIIWHPQSVNCLDPKTGTVHWTFPFIGRKKDMLGAGMSIPTPRQDGNNLLLTCFYDGSLMLKLNGTEKPTQVWRSKSRSEYPEGTDALHCVMNTPFIKDGHIYGVCSYGELRCIKEDTGKRIWQTYKPIVGESQRWGNAFLVPQDDRVFLFNEQGDLVIARLTPKGYEEISRANILTPTNTMAPPPGRRVIWSHPAFANRCCFARNDREIVCVSLGNGDQ